MNLRWSALWLLTPSPLAVALPPARVAPCMLAPTPDYVPPVFRYVAQTQGAVAPERTPLAPAAACVLIRDALAAALGVAPRRAAVVLLAAQWAYETGNGAHMWNYNFGGIKSTGDGLWVVQRTAEGVGPTRRATVDRFRAYPTAAAGAADYIAVLRQRYPSALQAARNGDAAGMVRAFKARNYFTGDADEYLAAIQKIATEFLKKGYK